MDDEIGGHSVRSAVAVRAHAVQMAGANALTTAMTRPVRASSTTRNRARCPVRVLGRGVGSNACSSHWVDANFTYQTNSVAVDGQQPPRRFPAPAVSVPRPAVRH